MSALQSNLARVLPGQPATPAQPVKKSSPRLRLVETPAQERSATVFLASLVVLLMAAFVLVLLMNTEMANGAYKKQALTTEISNAALQTQTLQTSLDNYATAPNLAKQARALGMVQMVNPGVISLVDSEILVAPSKTQD